MSNFYDLLTRIIACSKLEQAIILLRSSHEFTSVNAILTERIEGDSSTFISNSSVKFLESKYFHLQFHSLNEFESDETLKFFTSVLLVLDDKKDASSETLQLKRSKQELDIFTIFAHEFRTPLTVIQSSVELLLDFFQEWDAEKITDFLHSIQQQSTSISKLLEMIAELYDARSNTQEVVTVSESTIQEFFQQIESILSKRYKFTLAFNSIKNDNVIVRVPIRALLYVIGVALQTFQSETNGTSITVTTNQNAGIEIDIKSSNKIFSDSELQLLVPLFSKNIIEDVSGEWLPYLLASICSQYLNASITIGNTVDNRAFFTLYL